MFDDALVRRKILEALPNVEPWRVEMEEIDFGDRLGMFYRSPNGIKRVSFDSKNANEADLALLFVDFIKREPRVLEAKPADTALGRWLDNPTLIENTKIQVDKLDAPNYEGRAGRHPLACVCPRCVSKRNG